MERALQLARCGEGFTSPNPMVGAVIVADDRVIGEGYHRRCGGPHAEVWAVRSVSPADRALLPRATIYVTLEPCSHYGKTPPCAAMLVEEGIGRVVIGCSDPNPKVSGRGVEMLRRAGIEVEVGVLEKECFELNRRFMIAQTLGRPYVMLKWAASADGYLDRRRDYRAAPEKFSTELTIQQMHRLRSQHDALLVGSGTVIADNPSLTVRYFAGMQPRPVVVDLRGRIGAAAKVFTAPGCVLFTSSFRNDIPATVCQIVVKEPVTMTALLEHLRQLGVSSVMVEGGAQLLTSFVEEGCWDDARVEVAPRNLGTLGVCPMAVPCGVKTYEAADAGNIIINVKNTIIAPK